MIKRILVIFLCLFLTGCTHKKEQITTVTFATWGSASELNILKPIISNFEKENPDIKIELQHIPQDYFKKIHLLFASNLEPDIIFINNLNLPRYSGRLTDLSDITDKSVFYEQGIKALSVSGKLYAIPRDISVLVVYYNKDIFKKNGISYPDKDWSLEDLFNKAKNITTGKIKGIGYDPEIYYALPYIRYFKSDILDENFILQSDKKEFKQGIDFYRNLAYKYHVAPMPSEIGSKTIAQMFLEGKIGMHVSGRWLVPKYRQCAKFDWDVVNFPKSTAPTDASGWAVSKSSKHQAEAIKFILYLSDKKNIEKMSKDGLIIPARKDIAESNAFLSGKPENSKAFIHAIKTSTNTIVNQKYNKTVDLLNDKYFLNYQNNNKSSAK